jgi:two-component system, chemotaxis family, response regulator Rcp1
MAGRGTACVLWQLLPAPLSVVQQTRENPRLVYRRPVRFSVGMNGAAMARRQSRPVEILLVEDNPGDVRLTQEALKDGRVLVNLTVAADGVEAMEVLRRQGVHAGKRLPDLIVLDLNLPRKNGREVLEEIKADEDLKRIPVIVMTTSKAEQDVHKAYNLNANCYVTKPVDLDEFLAVVRSIEDFWLTIVTLPRE